MNKNIILINNLLLSDHLHGVHIAEKKLFYIQGNEAQSFYWEEYGLRLHSSQNTITLSDTCEVALTVLVGGHFKFPKETTLVSAVYTISVAKPLLKPLTLEIQHCVNIQTQAQANHLYFVRAPLTSSTLPYEFTLLDGGQFYPKNRYGSIKCDHFYAIGIVAMEPHGESDNEGSEGNKDNELSIDENEEEIAICEENNVETNDTEKLNCLENYTKTMDHLQILVPTTTSGNIKHN